MNIVPCHAVNWNLQKSSLQWCPVLLPSPNPQRCQSQQLQVRFWSCCEKAPDDEDTSPPLSSFTEKSYFIAFTACNMICEWGESDESQDPLLHSQIILQTGKAIIKYFLMVEEGGSVGFPSGTFSQQPHSRPKDTDSYSTGSQETGRGRGIPAEKTISTGYFYLHDRGH